MPSPQVVAREPGRRIRGKSRKPERREELPVDMGDLDLETPTPSQQSFKAGPGAGGGRERARRVSERMPKVAGAKAHEKSHAAGMLDKAVGKQQAKQAKQRAAGRASPGALAERDLPTKQPNRGGAKKQSRAARANGGAQPKRAAAAAEAAPTQRQVLRGRAPRKRIVRDEGVD